jgi:hypothetical protein
MPASGSCDLGEIMAVTTTTSPPDVPEAAPAAPSASLHLCGRVAAFRRLATALERARIDAARGQAHARLEARYPAAARDPLHDDRLTLDALRIVWAGYAPLVRECWAGEDEAPTADELEGADPAEIDACLAEIYRLNPFLATSPN